LRRACLSRSMTLRKCLRTASRSDALSDIRCPTQLHQVYDRADWKSFKF
jgi:hypothetical protein